MDEIPETILESVKEVIEERYKIKNPEISISERALPLSELRVVGGPEAISLEVLRGEIRMNDMVYPCSFAYWATRNIAFVHFYDVYKDPRLTPYFI